MEAWKGQAGHGNAAKIMKILPFSLTKIEAVMNGLEKYVRYNITTLCYTSPGDGPRSLPIEIITKQDSKLSFILFFIFNIFFRF